MLHSGRDATIRGTCNKHLTAPSRHHASEQLRPAGAQLHVICGALTISPLLLFRARRILFCGKVPKTLNRATRHHEQCKCATSGRICKAADKQSSDQKVDLLQVSLICGISFSCSLYCADNADPQQSNSDSNAESEARYAHS